MSISISISISILPLVSCPFRPGQPTVFASYSWLPEWNFMLQQVLHCFLTFNSPPSLSHLPLPRRRLHSTSTTSTIELYENHLLTRRRTAKLIQSNPTRFYAIAQFGHSHAPAIILLPTPEFGFCSVQSSAILSPIHHRSGRSICQGLADFQEVNIRDFDFDLLALCEV